MLCKKGTRECFHGLIVPCCVIDAIITIGVSNQHQFSIWAILNELYSSFMVFSLLNYSNPVE